MSESLGNRRIMIMMTAVVTVRAAACEPHACGASGRRQDGGVCVALGGRWTETRADNTRGTTFVGRRWRRRCGVADESARRKSGGRDCIGWPRRWCSIEYVRRIIFHSNGSGVCLCVCSSYTRIRGQRSRSTRTRDGDLFPFPCFYRGRIFFHKKRTSSTRTAQRSIFLGILFIVRVCKRGLPPGWTARAKRARFLREAPRRQKKSRIFLNSTRNE